MKDLTFNISETSRITGLSIDTLRYYDKIDLIKSKKIPIIVIDTTQLKTYP